MALLTVDRYRALTTDEDSAEDDITAAVTDAVEALEDVLDRPLEAGERTETLRPHRDGRLWPKATPIADGGDYTVDGESLLYSTPWPAAPFGVLGGEQTGVEVTYTGGFVERTANPDAANRLPTYIERDLAFAAYRLLNATAPTSSAPDGATSVSVGDVSVTYGPGGARPTLDVLEGVWSRKTLSWRYAPVGSAA